MLERFAAWLNAPRWPWRYAVLAMLIASPALTRGLAIDDYAHQAVLRGVPAFGGFFEPSLDIFNFASGDPVRMRRVMDLGLWPWWALPGLKTAFWRPVTALTHYLDYALWPDSPWLMHLQSLCWFGGAVFLAALWYRRVLGPPGAGALAALFFAVCDAHAIPAAWVANRNAEVALFWGVATLLLHDRWRRHGQPAAGVAAPVVFTLSLLSNEGGLATTAYLFAYAVCLDSGAWWRRLGRLLPYAAVVVVWRLAYEWGGYGAWGSPAYVDPVETPLRFLVKAIERMPVLFASLWLTPPAELVMALPPAGRRAVYGWSLLVVVLMLAAVWPLRRRSAARFFGLGMLLSFTPLCAMEPGDRLLLFPAIGGLGLIAMYVHAVWRERIWDASRTLRKAARALALVLVVVHAVVAPIATVVGVRIFFWLTEDIERVTFDTDVGVPLRNKTMVFLNPPSMFYVSYFPVLRELAGMPAPARVRSIAPNAILPVPLEVTRPDARTLVVTAEQGYPTWLMRDQAHAFKQGDVVEVAGMRVEILDMTSRGYPETVSFRFDVPLEDPSLLWVMLQDGQYVAVAPPPLGKTVHWRLADLLRWRAPWLWHLKANFAGSASR